MGARVKKREYSFAICVDGRVIGTTKYMRFSELRRRLTPWRGIGAYFPTRGFLGLFGVAHETRAEDLCAYFHALRGHILVCERLQEALRLDHTTVRALYSARRARLAASERRRGIVPRPPSPREAPPTIAAVHARGRKRYKYVRSPRTGALRMKAAGPPSREW